MRCSCRKCGVYMVQEEYGLQSGCKCPACGAMCHDCMGSVQQPLKAEELKEMFALGLFQGAQDIEIQRPETETGDDPESLKDWRKNL